MVMAAILASATAYHAEARSCPVPAMTRRSRMSRTCARHVHEVDPTEAKAERLLASEATRANIDDWSNIPFGTSRPCRLNWSARRTAPG